MSLFWDIPYVVSFEKLFFFNIKTELFKAEVGMTQN